MDIFTIDFETYWADDYTLGKLTTSEYIFDPRFEAIGVGVRFPVGATKWFEAEDFRRWAATVDWSQAGVLCHHTHFDGLILSHHFGVHPGFLFDTLSMGRALHGTQVGGSLGVLMAKYGLGAKGTAAVQSKNKRRKDFTLQEWVAYGDYCKTDVGGTWELFLKLLERAGTSQGEFPESELALIDMTVKMFTEPVFVLDEPLMQQFLVDERARKVALVAQATKGATKDVLMSNEQFAVLLASLGVDPPKKWSVKKKRDDWAFAKNDPGMQDLLASDDDDVRLVAEARIGIKSTLNESRTERFLRMGANGRKLPVYLVYHGAHTGRWSGGDKTNFQNLQRVDEEDIAKGAIRRALLAPPRHIVVVGDSAQIEARTLAWIAGQDDLVEAFRAGRDVYSEFASEVYHRTITKKDKTARSVGKVSVLGLGYSMGWAKASMTFAAGPMGAKPIIFTEEDAESMGVDVEAFTERPHGWVRDDSDEEQKTCLDVVLGMPSRLAPEARIIHCAVVEHIVRTYRAKNSNIVAFWRTAGKLIDAMLVGDEMTLENSDGVVVVGTVFDGEGEDVVSGIRLPSGLVMQYPGLRKTKSGGYAYRGGKKRGRGEKAYVQESHMYGGLLVENIVQALARVIVADQALMAHRAGYKVATTTHDEAVLVVGEAKAEQALADLMGWMKTPPAWCADLPLSAEGGCAVSYGSAK